MRLRPATCLEVTSHCNDAGRRSPARFPTHRAHFLRPRQRQQAFLIFCSANDEDECVLPTRDALRKVGPRSSHDSTTAFAVTAQGRLRVSISGYYYVFSQVAQLMRCGLREKTREYAADKQQR